MRSRWHIDGAPKEEVVLDWLTSAGVGRQDLPAVDAVRLLQRVITDHLLSESAEIQNQQVPIEVLN